MSINKDRVALVTGSTSGIGAAIEHKNPGQRGMALT